MRLRLETPKSTPSPARMLLRALGLIDTPQSVRNAGRRMPQARLALERLRVRTRAAAPVVWPG